MEFRVGCVATTCCATNFAPCHLTLSLIVFCMEAPRVSLDKHTQIIEYSLYGAAHALSCCYTLVPVGDSAGGQQRARLLRTLDKLLPYTLCFADIFAVECILKRDNTLNGWKFVLLWCWSTGPGSNANKSATSVTHTMLLCLVLGDFLSIYGFISFRFSFAVASRRLNCNDD